MKNQKPMRKMAGTYKKIKQLAQDAPVQNDDEVYVPDQFILKRSIREE